MMGQLCAICWSWGIMTGPQDAGVTPGRLATFSWSERRAERNCGQMGTPHRSMGHTRAYTVQLLTPHYYLYILYCPSPFLSSLYPLIAI